MFTAIPKTERIYKDKEKKDNKNVHIWTSTKKSIQDYQNFFCSTSNRHIAIFSATSTIRTHISIFTPFINAC